MTMQPAPTASPPFDMGGQLQGVMTILQQVVQALYTLNTTIGATFPNWVAVPASDSAPGTAGQVAYDGTYFYWCYATNAWLRVAGSSGW